MSLLTLAETKTHLGIDSGDTSQDADLNVMIAAAEAYAAKVTNRKLEEVEVIEKFSGNGLDFHDLEHYPITFPSGSHVKIGDDTLAESDYDIDLEEALITLNNEKIFTRGNNNCEAKFKTGYTSANLPKDLKLALLDTVAIFFNGNKDNGGKDVKSESFGDYSVTYGDPKASRVNQILELYKIPHV